MKYFGLLFTVSLLFSCTGDFVNHKLAFEKVGPCVDNKEKEIKMQANIAGERYEFTTCLDEAFDGKNYTVERHGDTIAVNFPKQNASTQFKLTLDIDARPAYHYIILDKQLIPLTGNSQ